MRLDYYAKAIVAALGGGYALFNVATAVDSPAGAGVTLNEWVGIAVTVALLAVGTWVVPNTLTPDQVNTAVAKAAVADAAATPGPDVVVLPGVQPTPGVHI